MPLFHYQTQASVGRIAQKVPTHTPTASSQTREDFPTFEELLDSVHGWLGRGAPDRWRLRGTSEDLERVVDRLYTLGLKPRCDWDLKSNTMLVRSPTGIHEVPRAWLGRTGVGYLEKDIGERSLCGEFKLGVGGARAVDLITSTGELGGSLVPDQSLCLLQVGADGKKVHVQDAPRIVMETSASQSPKEVTDKVFQWLYETGRSVHAVITCNYTNMPSPTSDKPFKAEIAVWVRPESGNLALDYPCDECYGGHEHLTPQAPSGTLGQESGGDAGVGNPDTTDTSSESSTGTISEHSQTPFIPPFDPSDHEHTRCDPGNPHRLQRICCRSGRWTVVYDESIQAGLEGPEPVLLLDVYDILRPCLKFPGHHITNRTISVPLGALREDLASEVQRIRAQPPRTPASSRPAKKQRTA